MCHNMNITPLATNQLFQPHSDKLKSLGKIVRKEENIDNHNFLFFTQCFPFFSKMSGIISNTFHLLLKMLPIWTRLKF